MDRRPSSTFIDLVLLAINPALIIAMTGSLVFFLLTVFYRGEYDSRLWFSMGMFVMATVCIARISIESGRMYAAGFALPLAAVTATAVAYFTNLPLVLNLGLLALIWAVADRLTWDCTVIDDEQDSTGSSLLQVMGWDLSREADPTLAGDGLHAQSFQEKWSPKRGKAHTPGVWVIYFSLAALPLFGVGQWFLPAADASSRGTAFMLLVTYLGSGLSLLMTTTFLGLRRYLRQRGAEMPVEMTITWLMVGGAFIGLLLLFAMALPRPTSEIQLARYVTAPVRNSWKWGMGNEAAQGDQSGRRTGTAPDGSSPQDQDSASDSDRASSEPANSRPASSPGGGGEPNNESNRSQNSSSSAADSKSNSSSSNVQAKGDAKSGGNSNDAQSKNPGSPKKGGAERAPKSSSSKSEPAKSDPSSNPSQPSDPQDKPPPEQAAAQSQPPASQNDASPPSDILGQVGRGFAILFQLLSYVLLAAILGYFGWKYRAQWLAAARQLWNEFWDFWNRLWKRPEKKTSVEATPPPPPAAPPLPPFASFPNPFQSGLANRTSPAELVVYSFRAFEAWSRERGMPRSAGQTPLEFAQNIATQQHPAAREVRELMELYCQVAYAHGAISPDSAQKLSRLWQVMSMQA